MSKKKPTRTPGDDARFESFLQKQFATLRDEIDAQVKSSTAKSGKLLELAPKQKQSGGSALGLLDKWKYGIAAVVVVAVAVPSVMQLNRQRAETTRHTSAPALEQKQESGKTLRDRIADREEADTDSPRQSGEFKVNKNYYGKKTKVAPAKDARDAQITDDVKGRRDKLEEAPRAPAELAAGRSEGYVTKEEAPARERTQMQDAPSATRSEAKAIAAAPAEKAERSVSAGAPAASPAPAPVFTAKKRSAAPMPESEAKRDAASVASADEAPAAKPRSFSLDDTNAKLKKQSIAEEEKTEMEKLWKEYEKNPQAFNKDASRSARLRTLLARHDTKSRAKRMKTIPAK